MRPGRLVAVVGTGTDVGKTWVAARLLDELGGAGVRVAARKPAQSFASSDDPATLDAAILGAASGEPPDTVCPQHRWYEVPMAPPMAAEVLGRPPFTIGDLVAELRWPDDVRQTAHARSQSRALAQSHAPSRHHEASGDAGLAEHVDVGVVETAGGVRSPLAADGDCLDYCTALDPDLVLIVADAGLGTINVVRLTADVLARTGAPCAVVLNRFDVRMDLHERNLEWLRERDGYAVHTVPGDEGQLANLARG